MNSKLKYNLYFILSALIVVVLIITLVMTNRKGTYSISGDNSVLSIVCPATANAGDEVTCNVFLNISNSTILSVNANYNISGGLVNGNVVFDAEESCNSNNCFEYFVSTNNGFSVINQTGATTYSQVGSMTFTVSGTSNTTYNVGLKNIELCNSNYEMISLNNVSTSIRIKNNDATLTNIALNKQVVSSNFDQTNHKYTATIADNNEASEIVNLVLTKSDTNATVTGVTTNLSLHYGTNTYNIDVTAEDGNTTITYTVEIKREYEFATGNANYTYNKANNYIYIKNDPVNTFTANLKQLPENLTYNVIGNKLEVIYANDEVLYSINIINFTSSYEIVEGNIYIANNVTLQTIKNQITSSNATIKFYDNNNTEITSNSTIIQNNYKVKVYYSNQELDSYNIKIEYLNFDNSLVVDDNKKIIKRIPLNKTYGELKALISTSGTISLETDATVTDSYKLRTGDTLKIELNEGTISYTLSVVGCLDSEVEVSSVDVIILYRYLKRRVTLTDAQAAAADISNDGSVGLEDVIMVYRYLKGRLNSLEV